MAISSLLLHHVDGKEEKHPSVSQEAQVAQVVEGSEVETTTTKQMKNTESSAGLMQDSPAAYGLTKRKEG